MAPCRYFQVYLTLLFLVFLGYMWSVVYVQPLAVSPTGGHGQNGGACGMQAYAIPEPLKFVLKLKVGPELASAGYQLYVALPSDITSVSASLAMTKADLNELPAWLGPVPPRTTLWQASSVFVSKHASYLWLDRSLDQGEVIWVGVHLDSVTD